MYITNIFGNFVQVPLTQPLKVKTLANWSIRATIASLSYQDPLESWSAFFIKKIADLLKASAPCREAMELQELQKQIEEKLEWFTETKGLALKMQNDVQGIKVKKKQSD